MLYSCPYWHSINLQSRSAYDPTPSKIGKMVQDGTWPRPHFVWTSTNTFSSIFRTLHYEHAYIELMFWSILKEYRSILRSRSAYDPTPSKIGKMVQDGTWPRPHFVWTSTNTFSSIFRILHYEHAYIELIFWSLLKEYRSILRSRSACDPTLSKIGKMVQDGTIFESFFLAISFVSWM
jgi:hypothetical protein